MAAEQKVIIYYKIFTSKIYSNLGSPSQIAFDVNDPSGIFPGPFFARVRLNFSEKVKIASYSPFWWAEAWLGWGRHFPNYNVSSAGRLRPRPRQQPLLIIILVTVSMFSSDFCINCWAYLVFRSGKHPLHYYENVLLLLLLLAWSWLVVCQHLTKHRQSFSHSLARPSFPHVLLRLQYVSSPSWEKMS